MVSRLQRENLWSPPPKKAEPLDAFWELCAHNPCSFQRPSRDGSEKNFWVLGNDRALSSAKGGPQGKARGPHEGSLPSVPALQPTQPNTGVKDSLSFFLSGRDSNPKRTAHLPQPLPQNTILGLQPPTACQAQELTSGSFKFGESPVK